MPTPLGLAGSWGYAPLDDWARGFIPNQAPFLVLGYALGSSMDWVSTSTGPVTSDDANDGNTGCFANDAVRDDDSP